MSELIHIAGPVVHIEQLMRQRCMWCGAMLLDYDLSCVQMVTSDDGSGSDGPATWEPGSLIGVDGQSPKVSRVVASAAETWGCPGADDGEHGDATELPMQCCSRLDPAVTT